MSDWVKTKTKTNAAYKRLSLNTRTWKARKVKVLIKVIQWVVDSEPNRKEMNRKRPTNREVMDQLSLTLAPC